MHEFSFFEEEHFFIYFFDEEFEFIFVTGFSLIKFDDSFFEGNEEGFEHTIVFMFLLSGCESTVDTH